MPRPTSLVLATALLVAGLATTGCLTGDTDGVVPPGGAPATESGPCAAEDAPAASGNAPLLDAFRGEPVDVAARFAEALQDPLASTEPDAQMSSADRPKYRTESTGTITVDREGDGPPRLHWVGGSDAEPYTLEQPHDAFLNDTLSRFDVSPALMTGFVNTNNEDRPLVRFWQDFDGEWVEGTGGSFQPALPLLTLEPAFDLTGATAPVTEGASVQKARTFMRCELDRAGNTQEAGYRFDDVIRVAWSVTEESLVRTVFLEYTEPGEPGHCGLVYAVDVDAETRAVLAWEQPPCD